jgi:cardiolipin synthase
MIEFFTLHFFTIVTFLFIFITIGHLLTQRKKPSSMIAWAVTIVALPYIGILFYIIFHGRKFEKISQHIKEIKLQKIYEIEHNLDSQIEQLLRSNGIAGATSNNDFILCKDGVDGYQRLMDLLESAEYSIYISTYIFGKDKVTKEIISLLAKKAKEGVEVKLLIDALGSQSLEFHPYFLKPLKAAGGEYHFFMSMLKHPMNSKLNLRNHRKMIVVDGCKVMSGGINISKEYLSPSKNSYLWMDLSFILYGTAALHYRDIFRYDWESDAKSLLSHYHDKPLEKYYGNSIVQVVPSGPDVDSDALYEAFLTALYEAKERIWIVTPYFAPDSSLMDALIVAKHRGVEIKIITPKISDNFLADVARSGFLRDLQKEDVDILFYKNRMMHAKACVIDETCAVLGSSNFDARSFFYNFEVVSFFYEKSDIERVKVWIEGLFFACEKGIEEASKLRLLSENFFKMFAPAL